MNRDLPESPNCLICCCCDEPAALRCHGCGEFYCSACFGPGHADDGEQCRDCAMKQAQPELLMPTPTLIIQSEAGAAFKGEKSGDGQV